MTGAWLSVPPSTVNGMELSAQEFRDALSMRYGEALSNLPALCDGCGAPFTLQHALRSKCPDLAIFCHNEIKDELVHMSAKAFTPSAVCNKPLICHGRVAEREKLLHACKQEKNPTMMAPAKTNAVKSSFRVFGHEEQIAFLTSESPTQTPSLIANDFLPKSWKHMKEETKISRACLERRRHFTPFVCSVDDLLGREATIFSKRLAAKLAAKWQRTYSKVCWCVNARLSIAIVCATHMCIRGSCVLLHKISVGRPQWEDGAGLSLFDC